MILLRLLRALLGIGSPSRALLLFGGAAPEPRTWLERRERENDRKLLAALTRKA